MNKKPDDLREHTMNTRFDRRHFLRGTGTLIALPGTRIDWLPSLCFSCGGSTRDATQADGLSGFRVWRDAGNVVSRS